MIAATALASIVAFLVALWLSGVVRVGAGVVATAQGAVATMRDQALDDRAREKAVQGASLRLMGAFVSIVVRGALTFAVSFVPIWLASVAGLASIAEVTEFLARWDVIVIGSAVIVAGWLLWRRVWPSR